MEAINCETASSYARYLATYIASPLKIEQLVLLEFDEAPPLHEIAEMRYQIEQKRKRAGTDPYLNQKDISELGDHYRMPGTVKLPKPVKVRASVRPAEPGETYGASRTNPKVRSRAMADAVINGVADDCAISRADILGRQRAHVEARAVAACVLLARDYSSSQVGRLMGRDHTTISNMRDKLDIYLDRNPVARASYERHMAALKAVAA